MEKMTIEQVRETPERLEPYMAEGQIVRVTRQGKPFFDAVPVSRQRGLSDFFRRLDAVWAESGVSRSTHEIVAGLRASRE